MLEVTTASIRAAAASAMADAMNHVGVEAGLPTLMWYGHAYDELVGQVWAGTPGDVAGDVARRWADQLELQRAETPVMGGTDEYRGQLPGGLPVLVWAVVDQARWDAAEAALIERVRRS